MEFSDRLASLDFFDCCAEERAAFAHNPVQACPGIPMTPWRRLPVVMEPGPSHASARAAWEPDHAAPPSRWPLRRQKEGARCSQAGVGLTVRCGQVTRSNLAPGPLPANERLQNAACYVVLLWITRGEYPWTIGGRITCLRRASAPAVLATCAAPTSPRAGVQDP